MRSMTTSKYSRHREACHYHLQELNGPLKRKGFGKVQLKFIDAARKFSLRVILAHSLVYLTVLPSMVPSVFQTFEEKANWCGTLRN
jgi:hypothetical protein